MDELVLSRAQQGDPSAQAAFLREVGPTVAALVRRAGSWHEPEDQIHDVFTHLLEVLPRFDPRGPAQLTTWVYTVAHRWLLGRQRKPTLQLVPLDAGLSVPSAERTAADRVEGAQLNALLEAELKRLPDELRRVFVLTQLHARPLHEVAALEEVPVGTVKSRLHRARALLVVRLGPALDRPDSRGAEPDRPDSRGAEPDRPDSRGAEPDRPDSRGAEPGRTPAGRNAHAAR